MGAGHWTRITVTNDIYRNKFENTFTGRVEAMERRARGELGHNTLRHA